MSKELESSLPKNPIMPQKNWTKSLVEKVIGRWVEIGWGNCPSEKCFVYDVYDGDEGTNDNEGTTPIFPKIIRFQKGKINNYFIQSPQQIVKIGPKLECPAF